MITTYTAAQKARRNETSKRKWAREQAALRKVRSKKRCRSCNIILEKSCERHAGMCVCCRYRRIWRREYVTRKIFRDLHPLAHLERFDV